MIGNAGGIVFVRGASVCWASMLSIFIVDFLWKSAVEVHFYVIIVREFFLLFSLLWLVMSVSFLVF